VYRWVDHAAEVELEIDASTERQVLADALAALAELLGFSDGTGAERREIIARAQDRPALLAAWLEELVLRAESEGFVATRLEELSLSGDSLSATVSGHLADPPALVKAVTYHRLEFARAEHGYFARVVLDV
jgi:SHS2 domain-containing protein